MTIDEVASFLASCGFYFLATVDNEKPSVRPFGTFAKYDNRYYIQTGKKKAVYAEMKKNPSIAIAACSSNGWIRLFATATEDDRVEAKKAVLEAYPSLQDRYSPTDDNTAVFALSDIHGTFTDADGRVEAIDHVG